MFVVYILTLFVVIVPFPQFWKGGNDDGTKKEKALLGSKKNNDLHDELHALGQYISTPLKKTKLFGIIDRIGAIVLSERLQSFQTNMARVGLTNQIYILDAIKGETLKNSNTVLYDIKKKSMKPNQIGCALSHLRLLQDFVDDDPTAKYIFIMEDDLKPLDDIQMKLFEAGMKELIQKVGDFDLFYLSYTIEDKYISKMEDIEKIQKETGLKYIWKMNGCLCASAYVISKKGAVKILATALPVTKHIDKVYQEGTKNKSLIAYGMICRIFDQDKKNIKSTLGHSTNYYQFLRTSFTVPLLSLPPSPMTVFREFFSTREA